MSSHQYHIATLFLITISVTLTIQCCYGIKDISPNVKNIQNALHKNHPNGNRRKMKYHYPRPFLDKSRGGSSNLNSGNDSSSFEKQNDEEERDNFGDAYEYEYDEDMDDEKEISSKLDSTRDDKMNDGSDFDDVDEFDVSSSILSQTNPDLEMEQDEENSNENDDDDIQYGMEDVPRGLKIPPSTITEADTEEWIASFKSQIQAIREEMEREATIELERIKKEILARREKRQKLYQQPLKVKENRNKIEADNFECDKESENENEKKLNESEDVENCEEIVSDSKQEDESIAEEMDEEEYSVNESKYNDTASYSDYNEDSSDESETSDLTKDDNEPSDDELLIVGETDESENDVVDRLTTELKDMGRSQINRTNIETMTPPSKQILSQRTDEATEIHDDSNYDEEDSKIEFSRPRQRKRKSKKVIKKKVKKKKQKSPTSKSTKNTNNKEALVSISTSISNPTDEILSPTLRRKIMGRSIQAMIILIVLGLVMHVLLAEGGGLGFLLKGLFTPLNHVT